MSNVSNKSFPAPAARTTSAAREIVRQPFFESGAAPPAVASLLLLIVRKVDVEDVVVVEASAPKVYPRVTLASASTLSGSVVRNLSGGEGLPNMFCLVASSLGHVRSQCSIVCSSSLQRGHRGSAEGSSRLA